MKIKRIISEAKWYLMWMVLDPTAEFLERHWWARMLLVAILCTLVSLATILTLSILGLEGYIPLPWWL